MDLANSARNIGRIIRVARRAQGLTQTDLAIRTGMAQATISKIERGAQQTAFDSILRLLAALQLEFVVRDRTSALADAPWQSPTKEA